MNWETAKKSVEFFIQKQNAEKILNVFFYGGEPLLNFRLIKRIVMYLEKQKASYKKSMKYAISTNGSLLNNETLRFLNQHHFSVEISFDVQAQHLTRKQGTYTTTLNLIKQILEYKQITLMVNSVFTSRTINYLT